MSIQVLPPELANQIAAGEVVERPASVVKELLENSLDAGASRIAIDIERGGRQLIRVRDDGSGVAKSELTLALSRHATSKISEQRDLEAIQSLGFRGEALASISSVSRLVFTSRPNGQDDAWQAHAQGRDMEVVVQPAAHPVGTTVEVRDLFFNTPARRRFLRTDKTEFSHIDELVRRVALSRFDVGFVLRHNGKVVRQLRPATSLPAQEKRVAAICSERFMQQAVAVKSQHDALALSGWLATPAGARSQADVQYCYVNGRMMRDRLLNHAIRQAYQQRLPSELHPAYVLYLTVDPFEVDVNVHPAKHEVRFHQARLVHDFVFQALSQALDSGTALLEPQAETGLAEAEKETAVEQVSEIAPVSYPAPQGNPQAHYPRQASAGGTSSPRPSAPSGGGAARRALFPERPNPQALQGYQQLLQSSAALESVPLAQPVEREQPARRTAKSTGVLGKPLSVLRQRFLLLEQDDALSLLCLQRSWQLRLSRYLKLHWSQGVASQPLLLPLALPVTPEQLVCWQQHQAWLSPLGFDCQAKGKAELVIAKVPTVLRQSPLQQGLVELLEQMVHWPPSPGEAEQQWICHWIARSAQAPGRWSLDEALVLLNELESWFGANLGDELASARQSIPLESALAGLML